MSKTKQIKRHLRKRLGQRVEMKLTRELHRNIISQIQKGLAEFVERQSNRITLWIVDIGKRKMKVVYDSKRKQVVTVLFLGLEPGISSPGNVGIA